MRAMRTTATIPTAIPTLAPVERPVFAVEATARGEGGALIPPVGDALVPEVPEVAEDAGAIVELTEVEIKLNHAL